MLSIKPAAEDLAARQPVWEALSDMFLDTDTSTSRQWRADQLARSPYSIEQLEFILLNEVYPICKYNLLSMADEWTGFDPKWLRTKILRHLSSPFRFWHTLNLGCFTAHASAEWHATRHAILTARSTDTKSTA